MSYRLHCFAQSGHSYKAALMLSLCGAEWEPIFVDFFNGEARSDAFRAINPMGECPVLEGGGFETMTQSGVILYHLAAQFDRFRPAGEAGRREALRWIIWENQKLNGMLGPGRFFRSLAPEKIRNEAIEGFLMGRGKAALDVLDAHLSSRDWIVGSGPTIADIAAAGYIYYPDDEWGFSIADYKAVDAWRQRLADLPGWVHPYELMPGHPLPASV